MLMLLLTSCSSLLLSVVGFAVNDWLSLRQAMLEKLHAQAAIIAHNSVAALTFGDVESANATLASLKNEADIVSAALFSQQGELFAYYGRNSDSPLPILPEQDEGTLRGHLFSVADVILDNKAVGSLLIVSDFGAWRQRQVIQLSIAAGVFVLSFLAALLLSSRLHRLVSEPILKLAATARRVSDEQNYALQAEKLSGDEIGVLVDDFNGMLRQIQARDDELQFARDQLESRVAARTLELTELTRQLEHLAYHDILTGLANRVTFDDHLRLSMDQAKRHGQRLAIFFLDLDRFKVINDTLGHGVGDRLLIDVSHRLTRCLRQSDTLARLGGDEFAILLPQIRHGTDAAEIAAKVIETIAAPFFIDGYNLHVTTSIGISLFPDDGEAVGTVIKNADTAMYRSKDRGRNQFTFFSAEMNARAARRLALETKLRQALQCNELSVHFQPKFAAADLAFVGVEALARWIDSEEGPISPAEFIPLAEECGLIAAVDEWVLEAACRIMAGAPGGECGEIGLAINLSPAQFIREDLYQVVEGILQRTGFPPDRLELEITESLFGPSNLDPLPVLGKLCDLGIELSIDDFGTAYSSLSRLKQLPLHTLKVDRSFVRDLGLDPNDEILVKTIIAMAHNLNLKVVAEGVETAMQYEYVQRYGCDTVQGFLFGQPVPYAQLPKVKYPIDRGQLLQVAGQTGESR